MSLVLPEPDEIAYRLWRLRRLIGVGAALPALVWMVIGFVTWPFTGLAPDGYIILALFSALVLGVHALIFPNANEETLAIAAGLAVLTLAEPFIGFSLWARALELGLFLGLVVFAPPYLLRLVAQTPVRNMKTKAQLLTEATGEKARKHFPPRPGQELPYRLCGPADAAGVFPVTLSPAGPVGLDADGDRAGPHVWARITRDDPGLQETEYLTKGVGGLFEPVSRTVHQFVPSPTGCRVTEEEQIDGFPTGLRLLFWLVDYQLDGLCAARDTLEGRASMTLRMAHRETAVQTIRETLRPAWAAERESH